MRYSDALLESLRAEGDPEPDRIVAELDRAGETDAVNAVLRQLISNDQIVPAELPDHLEVWLRENARLPQWAERDRLDRAAALFVEHGITIALILSTASLVECYAAVKGVKVLTFTYRLGQNAYRRVAETAQFLILIMAPGGLSADGQGIRAIQKVRLMHAAIRHLIRRTGRWNEAELGVPINQEDLLGTLMSFSYIVLRDLRRLGVHLTDQQAEDYLYLWRAVGEMLGIRAEQIPRNMAEAQELTEAISRRHHGPSPEGVAMTRALLEMHSDLVPGDRFDGVMPALVRHLVGDQIADWLEVPRSGWDTALRHQQTVGRFLDATRRKSAILRHLAGRVGMALMTRQSVALTGYERAAFAIPTALRQVWGLPGG